MVLQTFLEQFTQADRRQRRVLHRASGDLEPQRMRRRCAGFVEAAIDQFAAHHMAGVIGDNQIQCQAHSLAQWLTAWLLVAHRTNQTEREQRGHRVGAAEIDVGCGEKLLPPASIPSVRSQWAEHGDAAEVSDLVRSFDQARVARAAGRCFDQLTIVDHERRMAVRALTHSRNQLRQCTGAHV